MKPSYVLKMFLILRPFEALMFLLGKKSKNVFRFFEFRLGINFFHFRLRCFEEVESRLGSPEAGVEIDTGWKRALFYTFWNKAGRCRTNTLGAMNFLIFFYFRMQMESWSKFKKQAKLELLLINLHETWCGLSEWKDTPFVLLSDRFEHAFRLVDWSVGRSVYPPTHKSTSYLSGIVFSSWK